MPVVALHGWLMSPVIWTGDWAAEALCPWLPGHGSEPGPSDGFTMATWVAWLAAKMDDAGIDRAVLIGHSMGGMLAQAMAVALPERVEALVLVATSADPWSPEARAVWHATVDMVAQGWSPPLAQGIGTALLTPAFVEANPDWLAEWTTAVADYDRLSMRHFASVVPDRPDIRAALAALTIPTLVVRGDGDSAIAPPVPGAALEDIIPCATAITFPGVGHCPPLEAPDAFNAAIEPFLNTVRG
jgi:3-oxoadipate enol-lactonase